MIINTVPLAITIAATIIIIQAVVPRPLESVSSSSIISIISDVTFSTVVSSSSSLAVSSLDTSLLPSSKLSSVVSEAVGVDGVVALLLLLVVFELSPTTMLPLSSGFGRE